MSIVIDDAIILAKPRGPSSNAGSYRRSRFPGNSRTEVGFTLNIYSVMILLDTALISKITTARVIIF